MAFYLDLSQYLSLKPAYKKQANCFRTDSESLTGDIKKTIMIFRSRGMATIGIMNFWHETLPVA
jgi:hypothetical protein